MSETASEYLNHLSDEEKSKIHQDDDINNFKKLVMNSIKPDSSPLPWKYNKTPNHEDMVWYYEIEDSNGRYLAAVADEEKAIKIVHYANSYASLVEALETIANKHIGYEGYPEDKFLSALTDLRTLIKIAQSALAQAKGEAK